MTFYFYADAALHTSLQLDELPTAGAPSPYATLISVDEVAGLRLDSAECSWTEFRDHQTQAVVFSVASCEDRVVLRFPELAQFIVSDNGRRIGVAAEPGCSRGTVRHLLLDQALPRLLAHHGRLVLHAGAAEVDGAAVAFVGESGCGKSTLVASLSEAGHPVLCDDALIVTPAEGGCTCLPLYPTLRLWPDALAGLDLESKAGRLVDGRSSKRRLPIARDTAGEPVRLSALFVLGDESDRASAARVEATPLTRRKACVAMIRSSFQLDIGNPESAARTLEQAALVAHHLPIFELSYPHEYSCLSEVHSLIEELLQQPGVPSPRTRAASGHS